MVVLTPEQVVGRFPDAYERLLTRVQVAPPIYDEAMYPTPDAFIEANVMFFVDINDQLCLELRDEEYVWDGSDWFDIPKENWRCVKKGHQ